MPKTSQQPAQTLLTSILERSDPVTDYANLVTSGEIVAGPHVRAACKRHLTDLETGRERGLFWDLEKARYALEFFPSVLKLNGGKFENKPFEPELWQGFVIGSIFGWRIKATGLRRFNTVYVETGKGSGKSPLASGIGLFGLVADGEERAEIYAAATKKDQAMILFRDAVAMVDQSPHLDARINRSGSKGKEWNLAFHDTNSFFRPISADDGQSGPRPHMALVDEVHEHKNNTVLEMLRAGFKGREQPLLLMITNSGTDRNSVCFEYHKYGADVSAGLIQDDTIFAYICALDEEDDPFADESCWIKANPSLGVTIEYKYLRDQVTQARGMPSKEALVKRLNFCIWVESNNPWIGREIWMGAHDEFDEELLIGRTCYGGLDLSSTQDLTSLVLIFEPTEDDPYWRILPFFWLPSDGLTDKADKDRVDYIGWRNKGYLETTPGRAVSRMHVLQRIVSLSDRFDITGIGFDRWRIEDLLSLAEDEGLTLPPMVRFGQGFKDMGPAVQRAEELFVNGKIKHAGNPVLTWNAANAVAVKDAAGFQKISKDSSLHRVDGIIAMIMAIGSSQKTIEEPKNKNLSKALAERGLRRL